MVNKVEEISGTLKTYLRTEVVEFEVLKVVLTSRDVEDGKDEEQGGDGSNEGATAPASEELPANEGEDEERGGDGSSGGATVPASEALLANDGEDETVGSLEDGARTMIESCNAFSHEGKMIYFGEIEQSSPSLRKFAGQTIKILREGEPAPMVRTVDALEDTRRMFEIKQRARQAVHFVESRQSRDVEPWQSEDSHRRMKEN